MTKLREETRSIANRETVIVFAMAVLLLLCVAGAVWTGYWSLRFGLTPRPRLSAFQTIVRFVAVITALLLVWVRTDMLERSALICAIITAGSSGLDGLGFNSVSLQVVRLLFHFLAYALGVVAITRWFQAQRKVGRRAELPS